MLSRPRHGAFANAADTDGPRVFAERSLRELPVLLSAGVEGGCQAVFGSLGLVVAVTVMSPKAEVHTASNQQILVG